MFDDYIQGKPSLRWDWRTPKCTPLLIMCEHISSSDHLQPSMSQSAASCHQLQRQILFSFPHLAWNPYILKTSTHCSFLLKKKLMTLALLPVPSASMTRLARSRTASLTSAGSTDGTRSRACTNSDSAEGVGAVTQTMEVSCWTATENRKRGLAGTKEGREKQKEEEWCEEEKRRCRLIEVFGWWLCLYLSCICLP